MVHGPYHIPLTCNDTKLKLILPEKALFFPQVFFPIFHLLFNLIFFSPRSCKADLPSLPFPSWILSKSGFSHVVIANVARVRVRDVIRHAPSSDKEVIQPMERVCSGRTMEANLTSDLALLSVCWRDPFTRESGMFSLGGHT